MAGNDLSFSRRGMLKTLTAGSLAFLTPKFARASTTHTFQSFLPQDAEGPLAIHYQLYFPETTEFKYTQEFALFKSEEHQYGAFALYDGRYLGPFIFIPVRVEEAAYMCEPFANRCDGEVERDEYGIAFRRIRTVSVEAETLLDWTIVAPDWSYPYGFSNTGFQRPYRFELEADAPFSVSVEAGTSVYPFDQHSFEDGAAAATRIGKNTQLPSDRTNEADVMIGQEFTAAIPEEKARVGLVTNGFITAGGAGFGVTAPQNTRVTVDYPNGTEDWTLLDHYYRKRLLGDGGFYRLGLNRAHLANDPTFVGFIAGFDDVDDIRDAI